MDEDAPGSRSPRVRPVAIGLVLAGLLVLVSLASTSGLGPLGEVLPQPTRTFELPTQPPRNPPSAAFTPFPNQQGRRLQPPGWIGDVAPFLFAAVAVLLVLVLTRLVAGNLVGKRTARATAQRGGALSVPDVDTEEVGQTFAEGIDRLRQGASVDDVVLECWRRLETVAERSGVPREPQETATEFVVDLLSHTRAPRQALEDLAGLYRETMFSTHERGEQHRRRALECLDDLSSALGGSPAGAASNPGPDDVGAGERR